MKMQNAQSMEPVMKRLPLPMIMEQKIIMLEPLQEEVIFMDYAE